MYIYMCVCVCVCVCVSVSERDAVCMRCMSLSSKSYRMAAKLLFLLKYLKLPSKQTSTQISFPLIRVAPAMSLRYATWY
ncbi:hypothetical protein F4809DRAFT_623026 [Biscogniauxia mediterranea]|nr:hypothetical protein F4809DRAFT_623026 [Biscogniauxia mediterranea]